MPKKIVIVVEGTSDKDFLSHYIEKVLGYDTGKIEFIINGGKHFNDTTVDKLDPHLDNDLPIILFIDSDTDGYIKSIDKAVSDYSVYSMTKEKIFVFPNNKGNGCLETLLLEFIEANGCAVSDCLKSFTQCLAKAVEPSNNIKDPHEKYVLGICLDLITQDKKLLSKNVGAKLSSTYNNDIWNWDHQSLEPLKTFLTRFLEPLK